MDRIVVGVDGSPASTAAAVWAAGEAATRGVELALLHVLPALSDAELGKPLPVEVANAVVAQGIGILDQALIAVAEAEGPRPPRVTTQLSFGPVVPTLWEFSRHRAVMIALGQHDPGNVGGPGSVTGEMLQIARCPVAVVPRNAVRPIRLATTW